jgi:predicted membrane channel-forming protein YqfA (hemolysin III family)
MTEPNWRSSAGIFGILAWIALWVILIASLSRSVGDWPVLAQGLFYLVAGIVWILPLKPVLQWIETGRFRR